jgi:RHS repeat-associated protein
MMNDDDDGDEDNDCDECKATAGGPSEVELHSGAYLEDHALVTYQSLGQTRGFGLRYDSLRADPRPIVFFGYSNVNPGANRRIIASLQVERGNFMYQVPGHPGGEFGLVGGEHIWAVPTTAGPVRGALQIDLRDAPTGVYRYDLTTGIVNFNGTTFAGSTSTATKELRLVNYVDSPFGAGWGLTGLEQIHENPDGSLLLVGGDGSELYFGPPASPGAAYDSPPGDFSTLAKLVDGSFRRTMTDQTVYLYDTVGRITSMTDRVGNQTQFLYAAAGIIERIIDPVGLTTVFASANGRITSITDPANRVTLLEYDAAGNLLKVTDPDGAFRTWTYDDNHHITGEVDKLGRSEHTDYNFGGRVVHAVLSDGAEMFYDPVQTQYLKSPTSTIDPLNPPVIDRLVPISAAYSDSNGNVSEVMLDKQGQAVNSNDGEGSLGSVARNSDNLVEESTDARANQTMFSYDVLGNVTSISEQIPTEGRSELPLSENPNEPAFRANPGFTADSLAANDDGSTGQVDIGFDANFFGTTYSQLFVNNNGNVTFDSALSTFTPFDLLQTDRAIIAPFFADVDTRGAGTVTFGQDVIQGHDAFAVNWSDVGYFSSNTDKTNTFQLVLIDRSDVAPGDFDFEFNYTTVEWETGDASGGNQGLGGTSARAGYSNGIDTSFEISGSSVNGAFLENNSATALAANSLGSVAPGRYRFRVRSGEVSPFAVSTFEYDPTYSQVTSYIDGVGRQMLYEIDPATGNRTRSARVVGEIDSGAGGETDDLVTTMTYTTNGLVDTVTDPLGRITDYGYDALGRLTSVTYAVGTPDEATMSYEYDLAGNQTAMIDGNGNRTEYEYDALNRLVRTVEADPDAAGPLTSPITEISYDAIGNVATSTDARGNTTTNIFDDRDRLIRSVGPDPDGAGPLAAPVTHYSYDLAGNLASISDPNANVTEYHYDSRNRRIMMIDPDGGVTKFAYDRDDNLARVTDPVGNVTAFIYDARSRLVEETDPLGKKITYSYDASDNLTSKIDRNGRETRYTYDDLSRLTMEEWIGASDEVVNTITYAYDGASNLLSVADVFSALTYTYDARNRVKTVDNLGTPNAPNVVLTYEYDDNSNVLSVADVIGGTGGATTTYAYDALDRLVMLTQAGASLSDKRVDFAYNPLGQYSAIDRYSDLAGTQLVIGTDYSYDAQNRLMRIDHKNSSGASVAFYDYVYDLASRITQITDVDGVTTYSYDDRDQLTGANHTDPNQPDETYQYDANGNRLNSHLHGSGYVTGPANRLLSDGAYDYQYDDEGNMSRRTEISTGNYRVFEWDHRNRLIAVNDFASDGTPIQTVHFSYDGLNRRVSKAVDAVPLDAVDAALMQFIYDREDVILDFVDTDGNAVDSLDFDQRYLHGPDVDHVLAQDGTGGSASWLLTDELGTTRDIVNVSAAILTHVLLDTFGNVISESNPSIASRYLFTGREFDSEVDLYFFRARTYYSRLGIFISPDPIGFISRDSNLYRYVFNTPRLGTDRTGLQCTMSPDRPFGFDFSTACQNHDSCYGTCGASKQQCDATFLQDMYAACGDNRFCRTLANTYFGAVKRAGQSFFDRAQKEACKECKDEK